jgi:hypothetical protein
MMVPGRELMSSLASTRGRVPADVGPAGPEQTPPPVQYTLPGPGRAGYGYPGMHAAGAKRAPRDAVFTGTVLETQNFFPFFLVKFFLFFFVFLLFCQSFVLLKV